MPAKAECLLIVENGYRQYYFCLMRMLLILLAAGLLTAGAVGPWWYSDPFPKPSQEAVLLSAINRSALGKLRAEEKFEPNDYPPLGYTGVANSEDGETARLAVNQTIDAILSRGDGLVSAKTVTTLIGRAMKRVALLDTEDRERTGDYMIEIWYLLGFKGATGLFAYGAAFPRPEGYGEPLPPGWRSPSQPRPIGERHVP